MEGGGRMASSVMFRGRHLRSSRFLRRRHDSEEEAIQIDWSKGTISNLKEILWSIVRSENNSSSFKLCYLNLFTKLCLRTGGLISSEHFSLDEIFCCLRVALFHDKVEVRAAGLRAIRYLLTSQEAAAAFCRTKLPFLILRSLDIALDNKLERVQCLRLIRKLMGIEPTEFPTAITRCLVSISRDGLNERDILVRSCWAALAELTLLNPVASAECGGISAILSSIAQCNQSHHITESLLSCILYLVNDPQLRPLLRNDLDLQHFIATFTDCYVPCNNQVRSNDPTIETLEQRESKFLCAKNSLLILLRSWPGLTYLSRTAKGPVRYPSGLKSLIDTMHMPYAEIRRHLLELLFELLNIPIPDYVEDFQEALVSSQITPMHESWQLYDGFVASEGKCLLPHTSKNRQNLFENYLAILLYSLICNGLVDALVVVITKARDIRNSVRSTILLGEILYLSSQFLPPDIAQQCHSLPGLVDAVTSAESTPEVRDIARASISCLTKMHSIKKCHLTGYSLYLEQLSQFSTHIPEQKKFAESVSKSKLKQMTKKEPDDDLATAAYIKDSCVISHDYADWDWDLINSILNWPSDSMKKLEEVHHRNFIRRLIHFFKPSSKLYSHLENSTSRGKAMTRSCCYLLDFLLEIDETKSLVFLEDFVEDFVSNFSQISSDKFPPNAIFSHTRLLGTLSHYYFLFMGRLSASHKGQKVLEKLGVHQAYVEAIGSSHDIYAKLICSSLDHTKVNGFARPLLNKILTASSDTTRLYGTNFLRVLLRTNIADFKSWGLELLLQQLHDSSSAVSIAAADILDEACDKSPNLEALVTLRPSLLHLGDTGELLFARFASSENGLKFMREANLLDDQLSKWSSLYNLKYVQIVENVLNETLSYHRRSEDGTYGRRTDRRSVNRSAFIPVHMYGQLAQHEEGYQTLMDKEANTLREMVSTIKESKIENASEIMRLKAALWVVGHIGASPVGIRFVLDSVVIPEIVELARNADVLSLRGTAYYVLGLLSSTNCASSLLMDNGWNVIQHVRGEKWPLIQQNPDSDYFDVLNLKGYSWSVSSGGTRLTDIYDRLSGKRKVLPGCIPTFSVDYGDEDEAGSSTDLTFNSLPPSYRESLPRKPKSLVSGQDASNVSLPKYSHMLSINENERPRSSSEIVNSTMDKIFSLQLDKEKAHSDTAGDGSPAISTDTLEFIDTEHQQRETDVVATSDRIVQQKLTAPVKFTTFMQLNPVDDDVFKNPPSPGQFSPTTLSPTMHLVRSAVNLTSHSTKISPRASSGSLSSSIDCGSEPHFTYHTLPRLGQSSLKSTYASIVPAMFEPVPTSTDALGYATLRAIQRRRVRSIGFFHTESYDSNDTSDDENAESEHLSVSLNMSMSRAFFRKQSRSGSEADGEKTNQSFIGICLPDCLTSIFDIPLTSSKPSEMTEEIEPDKETPEMKTHLDKICETLLHVNDGLEIHTDQNCILCCLPMKKPAGPSIEDILDKVSRLSTVEDNETASRKISVGKRILEIDLNSSSVTSASSTEAGARNAQDNISSHILMRREVLRFVTNLSGSVAARAAEQGLLNLKQRYPQAFQDLCLYSEVIQQMSMYNFRLSARRFIQELFQDLSFNELKLYAEDLLRQKLFVKTEEEASPCKHEGSDSES